jgi:hypothetical protein
LLLLLIGHAATVDAHDGNDAADGLLVTDGAVDIGAITAVGAATFDCVNHDGADDALLLLLFEIGAELGIFGVCQSGSHAVVDIDDDDDGVADGDGNTVVGR